jgi:hypothetical protein
MVEVRLELLPRAAAALARADGLEAGAAGAGAAGADAVGVGAAGLLGAVRCAGRCTGRSSTPGPAGNGRRAAPGGRWTS